MSGTVRAAVLLKPKTIELREFARPAIGAEDALLRIEACGICGSDYEQYEGAAPQHEDYRQYPVIPGHEPLGIIEEIGREARRRWSVAEGDRVAVRSGYGCGHCAACRRFESRACMRRRHVRVHRRDDRPVLYLAEAASRTERRRSRRTPAPSSGRWSGRWKSCASG